MDIRNMMQVEQVIDTEAAITVLTTGAEYIFHKTTGNGKMECWQRINKKRKLADVYFSFPFERLTVEAQDKEKCILNTVPYTSSQCARFQINMDSMVDIQSTMSGRIQTKTYVKTDYYAIKTGNAIMIDDIGGIAYYPYHSFDEVESTYNNEGIWSHDYSMKSFYQFLISAFPPRPYNVLQSFQDRMYLRFDASSKTDLPIPPYPSNEDLERASQYTNIVWLKEEMWHGKITRNGEKIKDDFDMYKNAAFCNYQYLPDTEEELQRMMEKAHSLNMKVIPYVSPFYSLAKGDDYISKMENLIKRYGFDGVYLDGISMDIMDSYNVIRRLRNVVKDGIIFRHCTSDPVGTKVFCPFIDTYADYNLKAEHIHNLDSNYLRYAVSGVNTSNSIGHIFYWKSPLDKFEELIDKVLDAKVRLYLEGLDDNDSPYAELIINKYFKKLDLLMKEAGL